MRNYWLKSGFLTLLEKGSGLVFAFGTAVLLLRGLPKPVFAAWGLFSLVTQFVEMGRQGLIQNGLVRFLATARDRDEYGKISTASLALNLCFTTLVVGVLAVGGGWLADFFQFPELKTLLPIYLATNLVMVFFFHFNFVQQANLQFTGIFWSTFFYRGALFATAAWEFFFFDKQLSINHLAWSMCGGAVVGAVAGFFFSRKFLALGRLDMGWAGRLASYGKFVLGTNLATQFYKNADKMALGKLLGPAAYAVYDAAGKITQMVEVPSFSIAAVVFPQSARRMEADGAAGVKWLYEKSVGATLALILPAVVLTIVFAEPIIRLFAGAGYEESANVLRLTAFFGLFMPYAVQFGTILDSTGRPATNFGYTLFTAVLNLVLSILFIKNFGLMGAALATLVGYLVSFVLMQRQLRLDFSVDWLAAIRYAFGFYGDGWRFFLKKAFPPKVVA